MVLSYLIPDMTDPHSGQLAIYVSKKEAYDAIDSALERNPDMQSDHFEVIPIEWKAI